MTKKKQISAMRKRHEERYVEVMGNSTVLKRGLNSWSPQDHELVLVFFGLEGPNFLILNVWYPVFDIFFR